MQISKAVCRELERAVCDGPLVRLHEEAEPAAAEGAHKVLTRSGACWSIRHRGYMFADLHPFGQAAPLIDQIVTRRCAVNRPDRGVVSCPQSIAELLWDTIQPEEGWQVLEPSAGHGVLAAEGAARGCVMDCYEIENHRAADITLAGIARHVGTADFLPVPARPVYDAVVMYPPYRRNLAVEHVLHAHRFLRPGGVLAALVSLGIENAAGPRGREFRDLLERVGYYKQVLDEADFDDGYLLSPTGLRLRAQLLFLYADDAQE
ncbi:SAM-dependent methyltransferase [Streptomyces sp. NPDC004647]|uniref:SAM-dependent methyltransferase n=1 Tax=Streptomyces sp. NPDC004647 TaxID=3154671 RepID=UPI0033AE8B48